MDPLAHLISLAPPELIPLLILAYMVYQGWHGRPNKAHAVNDRPASADPIVVEEISTKPDAKD